MDDIRLLYIDLFCGAGGTSTGVEKANYKGRKCAKVIACVNHDANAIASHAANHPEAQHYTEDMQTLDLRPLVEHTAEMRRTYPMAKVVLWASLECTNFSKAKGGQPRDADSRTLAEHLFRYIQEISPDFIQIENVEEFMSWGDLDENGKPISRDKGRLYLNWVENVKRCGYRFDHRILNAADYGAYTSRKRFFGVFAKPGLPIVWPKPTHSKTGRSTHTSPSMYTPAAGIPATRRSRRFTILTNTTMIGKKLSPVLEEIEATLWEFEANDGSKPNYSFEGFRASAKIFMSALVDKFFEKQQAEGANPADTLRAVGKIGDDIRALIFEATGLDTALFYDRTKVN